MIWTVTGWVIGAPAVYTAGASYTRWLTDRYDLIPEKEDWYWLSMAFWPAGLPFVIAKRFGRWGKETRLDLERRRKAEERMLAEHEDEINRMLEEG